MAIAAICPLSTMTVDTALARRDKRGSTLMTRDEAIEYLRKACPSGTDVHCVLESVSRSGMSRRIKFYSHGMEWIVPAIEALGVYKRPRSGGRVASDALRVDGCGMDMGFAVVYDVSFAVHGDGYALNYRWL